MESLKERHWIRLMRIGHLMGCHQRPDRSFFVVGYQFPICARCTGVLVGQLFAVALLLLGFRLSCLSIFLLLLVMGADWGIQFVGLIESNNGRRFITGLSAGVGLTYIYYQVLMLIIRLFVFAI